MAHLHEVRDMDTHFVIDPVTRVITNPNSQKNKLMQGDHNSEIYTFEIPKLVEGHDMSLCNQVRIHYNDIASDKANESKDVYTVNDLHIDLVESDTITFSWLISGNATKYAGLLSFRIQFLCIDESGAITYKWHTEVFKGITVSDGFDNTPADLEEYSDILAAWEVRLDALEEGGGGSGVEVTAKPGQLIRVKETDENGKPTVWEAVPWGYTEKGGMVEIPVQGEWMEPDPGAWMFMGTPIGMEIDKTYMVNWDGTEYECVAQDLSVITGGMASGVFLGNAAFAGMEDTGEPFAIQNMDAGFAALDFDKSANHTFTIYHNAEIPHPIPGELLPEGVPYVEKGGNAEITISGEWVEEDPVDHPGEWMYLFTSPIGLKAGNTYIVNWNGTDYECVAFEVDMMGDGSVMAVCLGNASAGGSGMEDTGEPFLMQEVPAEFAAEMGAYGLAISLDYMGNIPFSIKGEDVKVNKIDPRCLPDSVGNMYTAVFDVIVASDDSISATAKQSFEEVYVKANDPNTFVRGFMKLKFYDMDAGMKPLYFSGVTKDTFQNPVIEFMALDCRDSNVVCWTVSYSSDGTVTVTGL